jgi:hypothetical protein
MVFAYYKNLSRGNKAIYRQSDLLETLPISNADLLHDEVISLQQAIHAEDRNRTEAIATVLINAIAENIKAPRVNVRVLSSRPSNDVEELHGLYEPVEVGKKARITVWMRTARHKKVVAFRSFLRTLLHELCHHIDYELFLLEDSFHTEGFFKRESHIFKQLVNEEKSVV